MKIALTMHTMDDVNHIREILVAVYPNFLVKKDREKFRCRYIMKNMSFKQAVLETKKGLKVTRPYWDKDMYMWWNGSYLVHTHPFSTCQKKAATFTGYYYVVEEGDISMDDWLIKE